MIGAGHPRVFYGSTLFFDRRSEEAGCTVAAVFTASTENRQKSKSIV